MKIAICTPIARRPHPEMMKSLLAAARYTEHDFIYFDEVGYPVDIAREKITTKALASEHVTHLMWIDDDMVFDPAAVDRLIAHQEHLQHMGMPAIVGGLAFMRRPPYDACIYRRDLTTQTYVPIDDYGQGLVRVDATGAAFLLTTRTTYETLQQVRPDAGYWMGRTRSEDIGFCERVIEAGLDVFVDTTLEVGHMAEVEINSRTARLLRGGRTA